MRPKAETVPSRQVGPSTAFELLIVKFQHAQPVAMVKRKEIGRRAWRRVLAATLEAPPPSFALRQTECDAHGLKGGAKKT